MGKIATFYSYKGGTGRSMALANVALALARSGQKVLTVDWDLEAPGLHWYFRPFLADKDLTAPESEGLIEFARNYLTMAATPPAKGKRPENWYQEHAAIWQWATTLRWPVGAGDGARFGLREVGFGTPGELRFVAAGRQDAEYTERVNTFDWNALYRDHEGAGFFKCVRERAKREFDWVLIDSRTGVSDTAGICTVRMPDLVVVCYTYNLQSIQGAAGVARKIKSRRPEVAIFPVAMRVEFTETAFLEQMRQRARKEFREFVAEIDEDTDKYFNDMEFPYYPKYAFWERLAAFEERPDAQGSINRGIERLAERITRVTIQPEPLLAEQRNAVIEEYDRMPSDTLPPTRANEGRSSKPAIRWGALGWAVLAVALAIGIAITVLREPSPARRKAEEIVLAVGSPTGTYSITPQVILRTGALLETAGLPEPRGGRDLLRQLVTDGVPTFADLNYTGSLDAAGKRIITCGDKLRVWSVDGRPLIAETSLTESAPLTITVPSLPGVMNSAGVQQCALVPEDAGPMAARDRPTSHRAVVSFQGAGVPVFAIYEWSKDDPATQATRIWASGQRSGPGPGLYPYPQYMALSADGRQVALSGLETDVKGMTDLMLQVWNLGPGDPEPVDNYKLPWKPVALPYDQLYATSAGFVYTGLILPEPSANLPVGAKLELVRVHNRTTQTITLPVGALSYALNPSGTQVAVWDGQNVEIVGAWKNGEVSSTTPLSLPPSSPIVFSPAGGFIAFTTNNGFDVRYANNLLKPWWAVSSGFFSTQLDNQAEKALAYNAPLGLGAGGFYVTLFQRDRKKPDVNAPWSEAMRQLRAYTSICLPDGDRQTILLESVSEAKARYAQCEVSQGRPAPQ